MRRNLKFDDLSKEKRSVSLSVPKPYLANSTSEYGAVSLQYMTRNPNDCKLILDFLSSSRILFRSFLRSRNNLECEWCERAKRQTSHLVLRNICVYVSKVSVFKRCTRALQVFTYVIHLICSGFIHVALRSWGRSKKRRRRRRRKKSGTEIIHVGLE